MEEQTGTLFNVLLAAIRARLALLVHEGILNITKSIWQTLSSIPPMSKRAEKEVLHPCERVRVLIHPPATGIVGRVCSQREGYAGPHQFHP